MEKVIWKSIIQDLLDSGLSVDEIKQTLAQQYPNRSDIAMLVNELKVANVKAFTKKAQEFGFGYGNPGPSNFNVPNPQGGPGTDVPIDNTPSSSTPGSSYTDKIRMRQEQKRVQEEEERRKKIREKLLSKLSAVKPGDFIVGKTPETVAPGELIKKIDNVHKHVKTLDETSHATQDAHEAPQEPTMNELVDNKPGQPKLPTPSTPTPGTAIPTQKPVKPPDAGKIRETQKVVQDTQKGVETLNKATEDAQKNIDNLTQSITNLGR